MLKFMAQNKMIEVYWFKLLKITLNPDLNETTRQKRLEILGIRFQEYKVLRKACCR